MILSIISLNYKKKDLTLSCLQSLYKQYVKEFKENRFEFIIVDNNSEDGSVKFLQKEIDKNHYTNTKVIANKSNDGFGKGCNLGAANAKGGYYLFLNNDTVVNDTGLQKMVQYMEQNEKVSILGGQLQNFDGSLQPSVGKFYTLFNAILLLLGFQKYGILDKSPKNIAQVDWVKGALLMIQKDVFTKLGGFDENIFMYTEDMELCYRAKLVGYTVYFFPDVQVKHADQGSSNRTFAIINIYKNLLYFYKKHRSPGEYNFLRFLLRTKAIILIIIGQFTKNSYLKETYAKALKVT